MCLIAFAWKAHPRYRLAIAANRDEFHERPTAALQEWADEPGVYGGRDLRAGGGWLVLSTSGRMAAVTNFREPLPQTAARSRGVLVHDFIRSGGDSAVYAERIRGEAAEYGAFNLLLWQGDQLLHASNRPHPRWDGIGSGIHGLSNGTLDAPWPKARRLTAALGDWLQSTLADRADPAPLFAALADDHLAADDELPDTGVGIETERRLSPPFIRGEAYGTRASSVLLIDYDGHIRFIERSFAPAGTPAGERSIELTLPPP
jgi:uncharacterized protein with NRDE domain